MAEKDPRRKREYTALDQLDTMKALRRCLNSGIISTDRAREEAQAQLIFLANRIISAPQIERRAVGRNIKDSLKRKKRKSSDKRERKLAIDITQEFWNAAKILGTARKAARRVEGGRKS